MTHKPKTAAEWAAYARKTLVAAATFLAVIIAGGIVPHPWDVYGQAVLAVLGTFGVYAVRNTTNGPDQTSSTADKAAVDDTTTTPQDGAV